MNLCEIQPEITCNYDKKQGILMEKKAVGRSVFYFCLQGKRVPWVFYVNKSEQYPIFRLTRRIKWQKTITAWQLGCLNWITW